MPALISATGVSPEPRMKLPGGALASIREPGPTSSLATPSGSRLPLIRLDQGIQPSSGCAPLGPSFSEHAPFSPRGRVAAIVPAD
jgi:hypothetical protein